MMTKRDIRAGAIQRRPCSRGYRCHVDPKWRQEYYRQQAEQSSTCPHVSDPVDWTPFVNGALMALGVVLAIFAIGLMVLTAGNWKPSRRRR
ncbi:MAG: hypothetical protein ACREDR_12310 [Blastocatellia bacterium]